MKTRKISYKNQKSVLTKNTLSSKAQINSSFLIPHLRNSDTTMSQLEVLGSARARNETTVAMVQQGPNPARDAGAIIDMNVDKNGEEDTRMRTMMMASSRMISLIIMRWRRSCS